jgi:hypothetical protein
MAADNTVLSTNVGVGETIRSLGDASDINWPGGWSAYPTALSPGANVLQIVDLTHGLPVQPQTGATWAITASSLPLPTGAASAANQATEIASLASIDGKITACNTGAVVIAAGSAVIGHVIVDSGTVAATQSGVWNVTNISGTVSLPTGAATAAKQPALGTAGTASADVITVQGITSMTALKVDGSAVTQPVSLTSTTITGTVAATQSGTWTVGLSAAQTLATVTTVDTVTSLTQWNAGSGTAAAALRVELPTNGTGVVGLNAGTAIVGKVGIDQTTPGTTNAVQDIPGTSGGLLIYRNFQTSGAVIAAAVKASAGQVYSIEVYNINATAVYVRLYNQTASPGTGDTVVWSGIVPGNTAGAGFVKSWPQGMAFSTGIGVRVTNAIADTDNTALTANTVMLNVEYK